MCLRTRWPSIKTATRDIRVYKRCFDVSREECTVYGGNHMTYKFGESNSLVSLNPSYEGGGVSSVYEGYHSYNRPKEKTNTIFLIPKGTRYITGWFNEEFWIKNRVSSNIVYVGPRKYNFIERLLFILRLDFLVE